MIMKAEGNKLSLLKGDFMGFPAWTLQNEYLYATIVPELGGRIMTFGIPGEPNLFYVFPDLPDKVSLFRRTKGMSASQLSAFRLAHPPIHYGGHKNWFSPCKTWAGKPYLDLDNAAYAATILEQSEHIMRIRLESPICRESGVTFRRTVTLRNGEPALHVEQEMRNESGHHVLYGLWDVTQMNSPMRVHYGIDQSRSRFTSNSLSPDKTGISPPAYMRIFPELVTIECGRNQKHARCGSDAATGWILTEHQTPGSFTYAIRTFPVFTGGPLSEEANVLIFQFADRPCVETEVLAPLQALAPGERTGFVEAWSVRRREQPLPDDEIAAAARSWKQQIQDCQIQYESGAMNHGQENI